MGIVTLVGIEFRIDRHVSKVASVHSLPPSFLAELDALENRHTKPLKED